MAKAKSGGTRSFLRGRIASDVYSIGKDGNGRKQQVVRSLAETVANPQTTAQMRGRMIMSTLMQVVSGMSGLIDHSFDNVAIGQPSISEFIRRNYQSIKADVAAHPASGNQFGLNAYQEKGAKAGIYQIAFGKAILPANISCPAEEIGIEIMKTAAQTTAADIRTLLGAATGDFFTAVAITADGNVRYVRFNISASLDGATVITADNAAQLFDIDNPFGLALTAAVSGTSVKLSVKPTGEGAVVAHGMIVSVKESDAWTHNKAFLALDTTLDAQSSDIVLPTYPVGSQKFLNGGDTGVNPSPTPAPTPTPTPTDTPTLSIARGSVGTTTVTVDGSAINSGATVAAGKTVNISVSGDEVVSASATLNGTSVALTEASGSWSGSFTMPSANSSLVVTTRGLDDQSGGGGGDGLDKG